MGETFIGSEAGMPWSRVVSDPEAAETAFQQRMSSADLPERRFGAKSTVV